MRPRLLARITPDRARQPRTPHRVGLPKVLHTRYIPVIARRMLSDPDTGSAQLTLYEARERPLWIRDAAENDPERGGRVRALSEPSEAVTAGSNRFASEPAERPPSALLLRHSSEHPDDLLTPVEVMAILRVGDVRTARRYMRIAGGFRLGREHRIRRRVLLEWIARCEAEAHGGSLRAAAPARPSRARIAGPQSDWRARIRATAQ